MTKCHTLILRFILAANVNWANLTLSRIPTYSLIIKFLSR